MIRSPTHGLYQDRWVFSVASANWRPIFISRSRWFIGRNRPFCPYFAELCNLFVLIFQEGKEGGEEIIDTIRWVLLKWYTCPNISALMTRKAMGMATRVRDAMVRSVKGSHFLIATERTHTHALTYTFDKCTLCFQRNVRDACCVKPPLSIYSEAAWARQILCVQACPWNSELSLQYRRLELALCRCPRLFLFSIRTKVPVCATRREK